MKWFGEDPGSFSGVERLLRQEQGTGSSQDVRPSGLKALDPKPQ